MDKEKPHDKIWLLDDHWDGEPCFVWCEHPAPGIGQDPKDAIGPYIHVDKLRELVEGMRGYAVSVNESRSRLPPESTTRHYFSGQSTITEVWIEKIEQLIGQEEE